MATSEKQPLVTDLVATQGNSNNESMPNAGTETPARLISEREALVEKSLWKDTNIRQKVLLADLMLMDFLTLFSSSIPSPFFARVVIKRGGKILHSALILQSLMLSFAIFCVVFGKCLPRVGIRTLFIGGLVTVGLCQAGFGFLHFVSDIKAFTGLGVMIRSIQGAGEAAFAISSMSIMCEEYPSHITKVFGLTEAMVGVGYIMGPLFGGGLYDKIGMLLPLVLSGSLVILAIPCHFFLLRPYTSEESRNINDFNVLAWLSNPYVTSILCSVATVFGTFGYIDVAITTYLEKLGFTTTSVGLVLFTVGLSYTIAAGLIGYIVNWRAWVVKVSMTIGFIGFSLILMIYVPQQVTPVIYVGSSALGIFAGMAAVPAFEELLPSDANPSIEMYSAISGAWYGFIGIGMFILPLIGSEFHKTLKSFSWGLFVLSCVGFGLSIVLTGLAYLVKRVKGY